MTRRTPRRSSRALAAVFVVVAFSGACTQRRQAAAPLPTRRPTGTYVAVGGAVTTGAGSALPLRDSFAQVFFRKAFPAGTVFVNVAIRDALAETAADVELPEALDLSPTVVTVLLGADDLVVGTGRATFEEAMRRLVHGLRANARTKVLVANVPISANLSEPQVSDYNSIITRICQEEGAELVDIHALEVPSTDGRSPNASGHAAIADAFTKALRRAVS